MGEFANKPWVQILAWMTAVTIVGLNAQLVVKTISSWMESAGGNAVWLWLTVVPAAVGCAVLLLYIAFPRSWQWWRKTPQAPAHPLRIIPQKYERIGVTLDYGVMDEKVLSHAQTFARQHGASVFLFHVVEGVSGQLYGKDAFDSEARMDREHLDGIAKQLQGLGIEVYPVLGFGAVPEQIVSLANEYAIDLLIMGGHRHRGWKDLFFGASISEVRHKLSIPVLVVQ